MQFLSKIHAIPLLFCFLILWWFSYTARDGDEDGTRWAVLIAGSTGFTNYRHQADVCHAYQLLRKGGLKDENIVVFMYDDIATNYENPRLGIIINHPQGEDVYAGVPKDCTGDDVTPDNLFAVLLGDKKAVRGGTGKVLDSQPNDRVFIYYSGHGGTGFLGMPNFNPVYAVEFINILKKKHESVSYRHMIIYIESCLSGSMFDGMIDETLNIYVQTASNKFESSYGTYCRAPGYRICLGNVYSAAWMDYSETHNLKEKTIEDQYQFVRERTLKGNGPSKPSSHVMEYGDKRIKSEKLYLFLGFYSASVNATPNSNPPMDLVSQRDAEDLFMREMYKKSHEKEILEKKKHIKHRKHLDVSVQLIGKLLYGRLEGPTILNFRRPDGLPVVDDWECFRRGIRLFESHCGSLTPYGWKKHTLAFANICNFGTSEKSLEEACLAACSGYDQGQFDPSRYTVSQTPIAK